MKLKQILSIVLLSAATTFATLFAYNHFNKPALQIQAENGKTPANYAGLFDGTNNSPLVDFQAAAQSAVPAVVHLTTMIDNKTTNNLPRKNPFFDFFGDDFDDFFGSPGRSVP
ncbi:MAG: serine protease, partial [Chitinophagaceae bacterium]